MIGWLAGPWAKLQAALAIAGAVVVAVGIAFLRGRKAGEEHLQVEQQRKRDALQDHYNEIDARPTDHSAIAERMRQRARDGKRP